MQLSRFSILMSVTIFVCLTFACLGYAQEKNTNQPGQVEEKKINMPLPWGQQVDVPQKYASWIVALGIIIALVHYIPRGYIAIRESITQVTSRRAFLETEKLKYEILKLKYEIEVLKKEHKISEIILPQKLEERIERIEKMALIESIEKKEEMHKEMTRQLKDIGNRKRFLFLRVLAFIIDYFIITVPTVLLLTVVPANIALFLLRSSLSFYVPFVLYFVVMWTVWGATVGKMIFGLKIIRTDGDPLTFKDVIIRFAVWAITSIIGLLWIFGKQKQSLWDKAAATLVVSIRTK